jgi:hypothetical protein
MKEYSVIVNVGARYTSKHTTNCKGLMVLKLNISISIPFMLMPTTFTTHIDPAAAKNEPSTF